MITGFRAAPFHHVPKDQPQSHVAWSEKWKREETFLFLLNLLKYLNGKRAHVRPEASGRYLSRA